MLNVVVRQLSCDYECRRGSENRSAARATHNSRGKSEAGGHHGHPWLPRQQDNETAYDGEDHQHRGPFDNFTASRSIATA